MSIIMIKRLSALAGMAIVLLATASCDSPTVVRQSAAPARNLSALPHFDMSSAASLGSGQLYRTSFTLTSQGGVFSVGPFVTLTFPANSVCDPNTSTYGSGHWNDPCTTLAAGQTVTESVVVGVQNGSLQLDFSTPVRFAPGAVVTESTWLFAPYILANRHYVAANGLGLELGIDYLPSFGAAPVEDALADPDVVTHVNWATGQVWRRIKHFSGYNILTGEPCTPSPDDPDCIDTDQQ